MIKIYLDTNIVCDLALNRENTPPAIADAFKRAIEYGSITPVLSFAHMIDFPQFIQGQTFSDKLITYYEFLNLHSKWIAGKEAILRKAIVSAFTKRTGVDYEVPQILFDRPHVLFEQISGLHLDESTSGFFQAFANMHLSGSELRETFNKIGEDFASAVKGIRAARSDNMPQINGSIQEGVFRRFRDLMLYVAPYLPSIPPEGLNADDLFRFVVDFDLGSCVETFVFSEFARVYDQPGFQRAKGSDWKDEMHVPGLLVADVFVTRDSDFYKIIKQMKIPSSFRIAETVSGLEQALLLAA
jgi:hypothetical protein